MSFYDTYRWSKHIFRILWCISDTMQRPPLIPKTCQNKAHPNANTVMVKSFLLMTLCSLKNGTTRILILNRTCPVIKLMKKVHKILNNFLRTYLHSELALAASLFLYFWKCDVVISFWDFDYLKYHLIWPIEKVV